MADKKFVDSCVEVVGAIWWEMGFGPNMKLVVPGEVDTPSKPRIGAEGNG